MKKPFEAYLSFIENTLEVSLLSGQKSVLYQIYIGEHPIYINARGGKLTLLRTVEILREEMARDNGDLLPYLYKLDGYTTDVVIYDELVKENK